MDWVGTIFVVLVLATVAGLVLEGRRRRARLGGPSHPQDHTPDGPGRASWQDEQRTVDQRFGGYTGG